MCEYMYACARKCTHVYASSYASVYTENRRHIRFLIVVITGVCRKLAWCV